MQSLRFNHVFLALLLFCAFSAFLLPRFVDPARAPLQNVFFLVSKPARSTAQWFRNRVEPRRTPDSYSPDHPRSDSEIRAENLEYHDTIANLLTRLQALEQAESQRAAMGALRNLCTPFGVTGGDTAAGPRQSLTIGGSTLDHLKAGMPVVFPGGLAGRLDAPGLVGTRVRLITDRGFAMTGVFKRYTRTANGSPTLLAITKVPRLVKGAGDNRLLTDPLQQAVAKQIEVNDWFFLDDLDWPKVTQGEQIGRVTKGPTTIPSAPGFAEIQIEPATDLTQLNEVLVVTK